MKLISSLPGSRPDTLWPCRRNHWRIPSPSAPPFRRLSTEMPVDLDLRFSPSALSRTEGPAKLENSHGAHESGDLGQYISPVRPNRGACGQSISGLARS